MGSVDKIDDRLPKWSVSASIIIFYRRQQRSVYSSLHRNQHVLPATVSALRTTAVARTWQEKKLAIAAVAAADGTEVKIINVRNLTCSSLPYACSNGSSGCDSSGSSKDNRGMRCEGETYIYRLGLYQTNTEKALC